MIFTPPSSSVRRLVVIVSETQEESARNDWQQRCQARECTYRFVDEVHCDSFGKHDVRAISFLVDAVDPAKLSYAIGIIDAFRSQRPAPDALVLLGPPQAIPPEKLRELMLREDEHVHFHFDGQEGEDINHGFDHLAGVFHKAPTHPGLQQRLKNEAGLCQS